MNGYDNTEVVEIIVDETIEVRDRRKFMQGLVTGATIATGIIGTGLIAETIVGFIRNRKEVKEAKAGIKALANLAELHKENLEAKGKTEEAEEMAQIIKEAREYL